MIFFVFSFFHFLFFIVAQCVGLKVTLNGLRAGALSPVLRLRQGNIAYTLLWSAFLFII
jgi:hypothetical protein